MLVTAQYGPVSEISYQPPALVDEEETRQLMDHKERYGICKVKIIKYYALYNTHYRTDIHYKSVLQLLSNFVNNVSTVKLFYL
jgi:hypothetical protein